MKCAIYFLGEIIMSNLSGMKKKLRRLGAPYKKSSAYEKYGDLKQESNEASSFWKTNIGYIEKYEHAKFQTKSTQYKIEY